MNDDLSRLLDGELPAAEAEALRGRIAREPDLARQWAAMQGLPSALAALPREMTPPSLRREGRPAATVPGSRQTLRRVAVGGVLLAAGFVLALLVPGPRTQQRIASGFSMVEGRVELLAGDIPVEVDGKIWVRVEPPAGVPRETLAETKTMDKSHFLAALVGSAVTLAVVEGTAVVRPADAAPFTLTEGESRQVGTPWVAPAVKNRAVARSTDEAIRELAALRLEHALTVGQLRALGGTPSAWPENLPAPYRPDAFEAFVKERAATIPGASLVTMDCDEYPCIAVIQSTDPTEAWQDNLMPLHDDLGQTAYGHGTNVIGFGSVNDNGESALKLYAFSIVPGDDGGLDPEVRSRLDVRVRGDMEGLAEELRGEPEPFLRDLGYIE